MGMTRIPAAPQDVWIHAYVHVADLPSAVKACDCSYSTAKPIRFSPNTILWDIHNLCPTSWAVLSGISTHGWRGRIRTCEKNVAVKVLWVKPLLHAPLISIAFHPFYGTPYIFPKLARVATPTLILLYHSHWLLLVTWDFRRWSHRSWLVRSMLHCYRVDFYKTFSPWKGLIWNLQTVNLGWVTPTKRIRLTPLWLCE